MAKREVIRTFRGDVDESYFEVEYLDTNQEWISAAGGWAGVVGVKAMYADEHAASLTARTLHKSHGHDTRYVKVTP